MAEERIDLIKKVYSKTEYPKIIDTKFSQLGVASLPQQLEDTVSVEDFFDQYNDLFYEIPAIGDTNSHEYLIRSSAEYINYDQDSELINSLQNEIVQLRKDLLQAQIEKAEALSGQTIDFDAQSLENVDDNTIQQITEDLNLGDDVNEGTTNTSVVANSPSNPNSTSAAGGSGTVTGTY
ncbi:MAG: hypothetical protein H8E16_02050 [Flavobacteriales bacterium]|nr:hypothetical protein [Flavobacteriales bacterium]